MSATSDLGHADAGVVADVVARAQEGTLGRLEQQIRSVGACAHPVRLSGRSAEVDAATGEIRPTYSSEREPDGVTLARCNNRRATVCPQCSRLYKGDARQIILAGLVGSDTKSVPGSVCAHPAVFVTLTAPSFGPVHSRRDQRGRARPCRPRGREGRCEHGQPRGCLVRHGEDDPRLGEPLCAGCYDYAGQVVFNAVASRLFKRTIDLLRRRLATVCGLPERAFRTQVRITYVRVAEMQARGVVHFHAVLRLDAAGPVGTYDPPPPWATVDRLEDALRWTAAHVRMLCPDPHRRLSEAVRTLAAGGLLPADAHASAPTPLAEARWGAQVDIRRLHTDGGPITIDQVANYIAKYATKSVDAAGQLDRPLRGAADLDTLALRDHPARLVRTCWRLGHDPDLADLGLTRWAHSYGYGGHWLTKSRGWSTTFTALRTARRRHAHAQRYPDRVPLDAWGRPEDEGAVVVLGTWRYAGRGYRTAGDRWLALQAAARARAYA